MLIHSDPKQQAMNLLAVHAEDMFLLLVNVHSYVW